MSRQLFILFKADMVLIAMEPYFQPVKWRVPTPKHSIADGMSNR
jgi:hypothetical protein